jgi:hypothetical protein
MPPSGYERMASGSSTKQVTVYLYIPQYKWYNKVRVPDILEHNEGVCKSVFQNYSKRLMWRLCLVGPEMLGVLIYCIMLVQENMENLSELTGSELFNLNWTSECDRTVASVLAQ